MYSMIAVLALSLFLYPVEVTLTKPDFLSLKKLEKFKKYENLLATFLAWVIAFAVFKCYIRKTFP